MGFADQYAMAHNAVFLQQLEMAVVKVAKAAQGEAQRQNIGAITNITQANPAVVSQAAHGYANADKVLITDVVGMTEVNNNIYTIANVAAGTYELQGVDSTGFTAYTSGGQAGNNALTLAQWTARGQYIKELLGIYQYESGTPVWLTAFASAIAANPVIGDVPLTTFAAITGITQANPAVVSASVLPPVHAQVNTGMVYLTGIVGMTELNDRVFTAGNIGAGTFDLVGIDSTNFTAYTSGGSWHEMPRDTDIEFEVTSSFDDMVGVTGQDLV